MSRYTSTLSFRSPGPLGALNNTKLLTNVGARASQCLVHHNAATRNAAMHNAIFSHRYSYPLFLQRHRCDALPCFTASPCKLFDIARIAFRPLLSFFLSPQWFTVQNNKKITKSHNAAMSPPATRDGHRKRKRKRNDAVHLVPM